MDKTDILYVDSESFWFAAENSGFFSSGTLDHRRCFWHPSVPAVLIVDIISILLHHIINFTILLRIYYIKYYIML